MTLPRSESAVLPIRPAKAQFCARYFNTTAITSAATPIISITTPSTKTSFAKADGDYPILYHRTARVSIRRAPFLSFI